MEEASGWESFVKYAGDDLCWRLAGECFGWGGWFFWMLCASEDEG